MCRIAHAHVDVSMVLLFFFNVLFTEERQKDSIILEKFYTVILSGAACVCDISTTRGEVFVLGVELFEVKFRIPSKDKAYFQCEPPAGATTNGVEFFLFHTDFTCHHSLEREIGFA